MAQIQSLSQSHGHSFINDDPDDSFNLELELEKLRSIRPATAATAVTTTTNGHGEPSVSLYSDRNRIGNTASDLFYATSTSTSRTDAQEQARKMRNQMILAKIQEIERNFTSVGLERQRKLDIIRREHEALIRKYRPMQLLYKHVGISGPYSNADVEGTRKYSRQNVPELRTTGVNTIITGPVKAASTSDKKPKTPANKHDDLESKHSSIRRRITFTDDVRDNVANDNVNLGEYQNNINRINPNTNTNNNDDWTNDNHGDTTTNLLQTFAMRDQFNEFNKANTSRAIIEPMHVLQVDVLPAKENEIKDNQDRDMADKLVDKRNKSTDGEDMEAKSTKLHHFVDSSSTTESEDNVDVFPARASHQSTSNANPSYPPAPALSDDDETSEIVSSSVVKAKDPNNKAAASVVNLSSDSSYTTFPSTHTNTTTSFDLLAKGKEKDVNLLGDDHSNVGGTADAAGATSLEILDGPGTQTVNDTEVADIHPDGVVRIRRQVPGHQADDNEDDNTQTSAAGESIMMDSNIKTPESLARDESELVNITEAVAENEEQQDEDENGDEVEAEFEEMQEVINRTRNTEDVFNEDRNEEILDADNVLRLGLEAHRPAADDDEENKEAELHTIFTKELLATGSDIDVDARRTIEGEDTALGQGLGRRMDEEMNPDQENEFPIEGNANNVLNLLSMDPENQPFDAKSQANESFLGNGNGDGEMSRHNAVELKDDFWNDSDGEEKDKDNKEPESAKEKKGNTTANNRSSRIRIKLNYEDSEESELSESATKTKSGEKKQNPQKSGSDMESPYAPYSSQMPGMTSDTTNFVTENDLKETNDSDLDDFFNLS